jgi:hypothetical protein
MLKPYYGSVGVEVPGGVTIISSLMHAHSEEEAVDLITNDARKKIHGKITQAGVQEISREYLEKSLEHLKQG